MSKFLFVLFMINFILSPFFTFHILHHIKHDKIALKDVFIYLPKTIIKNANNGTFETKLLLPFIVLLFAIPIQIFTNIYIIIMSIFAQFFMKKVNIPEV